MSTRMSLTAISRCSASSATAVLTSSESENWICPMVSHMTPYVSATFLSSSSSCSDMCRTRSPIDREARMTASSLGSNMASVDRSMMVIMS